MNGKMTAAVLYGKEDIKIEQVPIPRVSEGEVLIKVQVALTCGTDLKVYQRGYHARMIVPPALFGHELAGVIEGEPDPGQAKHAIVHARPHAVRRADEHRVRAQRGRRHLSEWGRAQRHAIAGEANQKPRWPRLGSRGSPHDHPRTDECLGLVRACNSCAVSS